LKVQNFEWLYYFFKLSSAKLYFPAITPENAAQARTTVHVNLGCIMTVIVTALFRSSVLSST